MASQIRVIQYGLGPIGCAVARLASQRDEISLVGGVDINPEMVGQDLGTLIGLEQPLGVPVSASLSDALRLSEAEVVLHTTSSYFDSFNGQIVEILANGLDVISTAEELSFPWLANPRNALALDRAAKSAGRTVLGTGINPGYLMDSLPLSLTGLCQRVDHIAVTRVINASERRGPFQAKIGSGLSVEDFNERIASGRMGHVGLPESIGMIFHTIGKQLVRYESSVEPVIAETQTRTTYFDVPPGKVKGLRQTARGFSPDGELVALTFVAALDAGDDGDTIQITGLPDLEVKLRGTNGDLSTAAIVVNAVKRVVSARAGLATMRDLPIVTI